MKRIKDNGAGQISFDLAFAVIMVIIVTTMLISYWTTSESSANRASKQMAYNSVAGYVATNLNEVYNSYGGLDGTAIYSLKMPEDFTGSGSVDNKFDIDYTVSISGKQVRVYDLTGAQKAESQLGFSCGPVSGKTPSSVITLTCNSGSCTCT